MSSEGDAGRASTADQVRCTEELLAVTPDALVVSNLGVASYVLAGVEDRDRNFYCWGSMGSTTAVGLGLATAVDEQVTVLDGDGSLLMSMGTLGTVAERAPPNLTVVVWDNGTYGTTGGQPTISDTVDLAGVAEQCGLPASRVASADEFRDAYRDAVERDAPSVVVCDVETVDPDARPPMDFAEIKRRFRRAATGEG